MSSQLRFNPCEVAVPDFQTSVIQSVGGNPLPVVVSMASPHHTADYFQ